MKLLLAAPFSGFPFDPIAFGAHASRLHFIMKLIFAAPTSGLPFFPTALLAHVSCPAAEPIANAITNATYINIFILASFLERACARQEGAGAAKQSPVTLQYSPCKRTFRHPHFVPRIGIGGSLSAPPLP